MSGDFFTSVPARPARSPSAAPDAHDDFAHAISLRFGAADLRTARLLPGDLPQHPAHRTPPPHSLPLPLCPPAPAPQQEPFSAVPPSTLSPYIDDPASLVLDIRPFAAHAAARIRNAISLSVPTTLLKRPLFSLSKLSQMLPSPSSRARFADWSSASRILVYDSDSTVVPDNSILAGLLRKFRAEGFTAELGWVRGGFQAVWREARQLATTEHPLPEEDEQDSASSSGTLRTSYLPKAAFSLFSTTAAPLQLAATVAYPYPNTPAPSAARAANPFFDAIRQNVELSHGITERIPLRLPRRVRRRIHDLPFPWLQDIARRSALRHTSTARHPGLDSLESGSESSDDPHTSDLDENDPSVEEGAEVLAMQFYRIELAEQRRLRSIMEHHTRESELAGQARTGPPRSRGTPGATISPGPVLAGVNVRIGAKSVPGTPCPAPFPFSITAGVEKGTKNRYNHIWPFEHARVRLHDARHQGSHPARRDRGKPLERGRSAGERAGDKDRAREEQDRHRRSRSSPGLDKPEAQQTPKVADASSKCLADSDAQSSAVWTGVEPGDGLANPTLSQTSGVPRVKIEYDITEQDSRISGPSTPATAFPLATPPFYTPMDTSPMPTSMYLWPPQLVSLSSSISAGPGSKLGSSQFTLPVSTLPSLGSFPLRLPNRSGGLLPSIGEHSWTSESLSPSAVPSSRFPTLAGTSVDPEIDTGMKRDLRNELSPGDDYVNASYVQPLGTRKRYIATQGPLPSTYVDFWTLVWEQNVHVIVMLTREVENAMVKCGSYWTDTEYGPLRLELLSVSPPLSTSANTTSTDMSKQGFFAIREPRGKPSSASRDQSALITRVFALSHTSYPGTPSRKITHLQYLDWSDMNVPDDPRGVLDLVRKLGQAVAESTPGPSPNGSLSPGSVAGSRSGSQSPEVGPDQKGHDSSLLSPISAGFVIGGGRRRGNEWRHPELDPKTGIAASALCKTAPVLLHCSAGVGRTGGFIAVDAVLDGIRRELRKNREARSLKKASGVSMGTKVDMNNVRASRESSLESAPGVTSEESGGGKESASDGSDRMDVDEPIVDEAEESRDPLHGINTVPIHVSAGERVKGHRHRDRDPSDEQRRASSESLVVHVPFVATDNVPDETNIAGIALDNPKEAGWLSSSTREWAEQVSDQTHAHAEEGDPSPPPPSLSLSSRERSPASTSNGSGPSALNSADELVNGSISANASRSSSGCRSQSGDKAEWENGTGSVSGSGTDSRSGRPSASSVSKSGSGSISLSGSGSGTGTGSQLGSSLLRVHLRDSSVTSISVESTDSLSSRPEAKLNTPLDQPSAAQHTSSGFNMEIDNPACPVSASLQPTRSSTVNVEHVGHCTPVLGSSHVTSFSNPSLPPGPAARVISTSGDAENSAPRSELVQEAAVPSKRRGTLRLDTELGILGAPHSSFSTKSPRFASRESKGREGAVVSPVPRARDGSVSPAPRVSDALEHDQRNMDHQVVDYILPRELHSELSPPLISSFAEPICTVIQDMREQRMSLCQSLRQYVFVHAAIVEGALRIVDEERELWGSIGTSDDADSTEGEPGAGTRRGGRRSTYGEGPEAWSGWMHKAEATVMTPEHEHGSTPHWSRELHIISQPLSHWNSEAKIGGSQAPLVPISSSSSVSSPSKGKRGPSPTELLREDKTGALSLNKRPSIDRQTTTHEEDDQVPFEMSGLSPVADADGGVAMDAAVGIPGARRALGRPGAQEKGGLAVNDWVAFE